MQTRLLLFGIFGLVSLTQLQAADPVLFPIRQDGKFGYINPAGQIIIAPRFFREDVLNSRPRFVEGLEPAWVDNQAGFIDATGRMIIEPRFSLALLFSEGLAAVRSSQNGQWGYIDRTGKFVIEPQFDEADKFSEGLASVRRDHRMGYIDKSGAFVISAQFQTSSPVHSRFKDGLACVHTNGHWGFIDRRGTLVIDAQFYSPSSFYEGLAVGQYGDQFARRWGYIDKTGAFAIPARFRLAWEFSEGLARVQDEKGQMTFIDKTGNVVFTVPGGDWAGVFSEGLVNVKTKVEGGRELWGYVERSGQWVIQAQYQQAGPFQHGLAAVAVADKLAYIDRTGRYVWGPDSGNEAVVTKVRAALNQPDRQQTEAEILRLAQAIDAAHPPLTAEMLATGQFRNETFSKLTDSGTDQARQLLEKLLTFTPGSSLAEQAPEMAYLLQENLHRQVISALVQLGDPFVVPALRVRLNDAVQAGAEVSPRFKAGLPQILDALGQFRDTASWPAILTLAKSPALSDSIHDTAFAALAAMDVPATKPLLLEALQNERVSMRTRCQCAAALTRMGEAAGRKFLLQMHDAYLASLSSPRHEPVEVINELQFLGNPELIAAVQAKFDTEPPGTTKNNIKWLLSRMVISGKSIEELKALAQTGELDLRLHAIQVLGRRGGTDLIPFIESLRAAAAGNQSFEAYARQAIRQIRLRHWQL